MHAAMYKGKKYLVLFCGETKFGKRAKLAFFNRKSEFWVDADKVSPVEPVYKAALEAQPSPSQPTEEAPAAAPAKEPTMWVNIKRILAKAKDEGGFLNEFMIEQIAEQDPARQLLVRCNLGRFLCAARECLARVAEVNERPDDYVRDVSLPTTDPVWSS
jgi:hypothetical protein